MRLTLRTLLAYLDEQLTPHDTEEIGTKIEKSDFAQRLQRRIRMLLNRRNISAPKVLMRGIGDPNVVAEYLDSTLPPDQVADFEKVCLESDIHLAEVAACHQVLITLGRSEAISSELRQRIYRFNKFPIDEVLADSDSDAAVEQHGDIQEHFVDSLAEKIVPGHEVFELSAPSHLEDSRWDEDQTDNVEKTAQRAAANATAKTKRRFKVLPILATVASLMLLALVIVWATQNPRKQTAGRESTERNDSATEIADSSDEAFDERAFKELEKLGTELNDKDSEQDSEPLEKPADDLAVKATPPPNIRTKSNVFSPPTDSTQKGMDDRQVIKISLDADPAATADAAIDTAHLGQAELFGFEVKAIGETVATLENGSEILARLDAESGQWAMVPAGSPINANEPLLTFPFFRPQLVFGGVQVTACGAGAAQALPLSEKNVDGLLIQSGRYLFQTAAGKNFTEFRILAGDISGNLTLVDQQSIVALEVLKYLPPGIDPRSEQASQAVKTIVQVFGVVGRAMWVDQREVRRLEKGDVKVYVSGQEPRSGRALAEPNWTTSDVVSDFELADKELLYSLACRGAPMEASLLEALNADAFAERIRAKLLAQICLLQLGNSPSLIALLDDPEPAFTRLWVWREALATARRSLDRNPASAADFQKKLAAADQDGQTMYRVLFGFSNAQLAAGADANLVKLLDDERLAMRVLAHQILWGITGDPLLFRPETNPRVRARHLESWKSNLASQAIRYQNEQQLPTWLLEAKD